MEGKVSNTKTQIYLPLVLCLGIAGGIFIGKSLHQETYKDHGLEVQKFREVLGKIENDYLEEVETGELVDEAIAQMLTKLDPHSAFIPADMRIRANEDLKGNFEGIGIQFNIFNDTIVVVSPLSGGPSEALGIQSGDRIIGVDGESVAGIGISNEDVMRYLKGPKGSEVKVTILRRGKTLDYTIVREKIPQYSVDASYMLSDDIGYIKVSRFAEETHIEFMNALNKLVDKGMTRLVLDLQGNPGGYLHVATRISDEFLSLGKTIVYTKGKNPKYNQSKPAEAGGAFETGDLIVLVNEGSASASEIVSGALQDNDRALIVGRRSFGKGLVQSPFTLSDGSEIRLTISRYYTPSGRSIQKPYGNNTEYDRDLISRYNHGEFFHADSIQFNDSLKFKTVSGRTVYGGGGIMPDYFVPLDTMLNSHYLNELYTSNAIFEYVFYYSEQNKERLEEQGFESFEKDFIVTKKMLDELVQKGIQNGVEPNYVELANKRKAFQIHLKAQIARRIWDNDGFYPIFNQSNEVLLQAIRLFDRVPDIKKEISSLE